MGQVGILMDPCVPGTLAPGHFSATAVWMRGTHTDGLPRPWVEFGIMKDNNLTNSAPLTYYAFCGNCPDRIRYFGTPKQDDMFMWYYTPNTIPGHDCWHLFVGSSWVVAFCGISLMKSASEVKVGGEATHWDIDIGPQEFKRLYVLRGNGPWEVFAPSDTAYIRSRYVNRHFDKFDTRPEGGLVDVFSRHFLFDEASACDIW